MGSSDLAPRELPPWLQQQRQNGGQPAGSAPSPSSYSLLQDASGDLKDAKDTRSTSPEDSKKLEEVCACHVLVEHSAVMSNASRMSAMRVDNNLSRPHRGCSNGLFSDIISCQMHGALPEWRVQFCLTWGTHLGQCSILACQSI